MQINFIICPASIEEKLYVKHNVQVTETRELLLNQPRIRFAEKGHTPGENVYGAFGQTFSGRYLAVFYIYKAQTETAVIISARDMTRTERKRYGRK